MGLSQQREAIRTAIACEEQASASLSDVQVALMITMIITAERVITALNHSNSSTKRITTRTR